jgi:Putative Actinobacterial Holin-X, holin superfamily III
MSGLAKSHADSPAAGEDAGLGNALERVYEAGQGLIVRRIDLLAGEIAEQGRSVFVSSLAITIGVVVALVGWFIAIAGIVDALDDRFPRFAVEIVIGALHAGVGAAIAVQARQRTSSKAGGHS